VWTRDALEAKVDELGPGEELERFAADLSAGERETLQEILLAKSGMVGETIRARLRAKGWLRRTLDSTERRTRR
jgi:hypothetical protein